MLIPCAEVLVVVADPKMLLERLAPGVMVLDEHGGTYVLRVEDLAVAAAAPEGGDPGIRLEIPLADPEPLIRSLEGFAAEQQLPRPAASAPELLDTAILAACHLPGANLFVFAEEPNLAIRRCGAAVELLVSGGFQARRVPCRETDLVLHLDKAAMGRLVAFVLGQARGGG